MGRRDETPQRTRATLDPLADRTESLTSLGEARRQMLEAVTLQQELDKTLKTASALAEQLHGEALRALEQGDRSLVRLLLDQRVEVLKLREEVAEERRAAAVQAAYLKVDVLRMQRQADGVDDPSDRARD
jgi:phage shock protein A